MADLLNVWTFFDNADQYAEFLHRVSAALVETALDVRDEEAPDPVTGGYAARQAWAVAALGGPDGAQAAAVGMLPALAVKANDGGLLDDEGNLTATDQQIRTTVAALVDALAGYYAAP